MALCNRKEKIKKNCKNCNKKFEVLPSRNFRQFCSHSCATQYKHKIGIIKCPAGWNKGQKMSEEWKEKLRQAKLKNPVRYWLGKERLNLRKSIPSDYRMRRKQTMESGKYKRWRMKVFQRDNYTCQVCGIKNEKGLGITVKFNVHHIIPMRIDESKCFDIDNGITLCEKCHRKTFYKEKEFENKFKRIIN